MQNTPTNKLKPRGYLPALLVLLIVAISTYFLATAHIQHRAPHTTESVFVYGTLTNPVIRSLVCRCLVSGIPSTLPDHAQDGLTIYYEPGSQVNGYILLITPSELQRLDKYERTPNRYRRETVRIDNQQHWVYIKN